MHRTEEETDLLISRMIDGVADDIDRNRFDELAEADPALWRHLALRQGDAGALADEVRAATSRAMRVGLPVSWLLPRQMSWPLALSGWAAVAIMALTWWALGFGHGSGRGATLETAAGQTETVSPEEHLRSYLDAPYVLGAEPELIEVSPLSDGRIAVHFLRKIEEVAFLDPEHDLPVDDEGNLTSDPARLRAAEPEVVLGFE